jgi:uncharacterized protein (DUF488 family)
MGSSAAVTFTIGYEGRTVAEFIELLVDAGVDRVVDVRALPLSRKKGFSKTALGQALGRSGIEYVHVRAAGNPYRDRRNEISLCLALYGGHLDKNPGVLDALDDVLTGHRAAILCVEADACLCHRSVLVDRLRRLNPRRSVRHL